MMRLVCALASILLAVSAAPTLAANAAPSPSTAANATLGRVLATTCVFCHGIKDYTVPYPTLHVPLMGGQHARYMSLRSRNMPPETVILRPCMLRRVR